MADKPNTPKNPQSKPEEQGRLGETEVRRKQQNPNEAVGDQMEDRPNMPEMPDRTGAKQVR